MRDIERLGLRGCADMARYPDPGPRAADMERPRGSFLKKLVVLLFFLTFAAAAYLVYGFYGQTGKMPWQDVDAFRSHAAAEGKQIKQKVREGSVVVKDKAGEAWEGAGVAYANLEKMLAGTREGLPSREDLSAKADALLARIRQIDKLPKSSPEELQARREELERKERNAERERELAELDRRIDARRREREAKARRAKRERFWEQEEQQRERQAAAARAAPAATQPDAQPEPAVQPAAASVDPEPAQAEPERTTLREIPQQPDPVREPPREARPDPRPAPKAKGEPEPLDEARAHPNLVKGRQAFLTGVKHWRAAGEPNSPNEQKELRTARKYFERAQSYLEKVPADVPNRDKVEQLQLDCNQFLYYCMKHTILPMRR